MAAQGLQADAVACVCISLMDRDCPGAGAGEWRTNTSRVEQGDCVGRGLKSPKRFLRTAMVEKHWFSAPKHHFSELHLDCQDRDEV